MGGGIAPYPWSVILPLIFVYLLVFIALKSDRYAVLRHLSGATARKVIFAAAIVMCVCFGFTAFAGSWVYHLIILCLAGTIGLSCVSDLQHLSIDKIAAFPAHLALLLLLIAMAFGAADRETVFVEAHMDSPVSTGLDPDGNKVDLPFSLTLKGFTIEEYPSSPIVEGHRKGKWELEVAESYDMAFPEAFLDSTANKEAGYRALKHIGAAPAAYVKARGPKGETAEGWVCPGSFILEERQLELPGGASVIYPKADPKQYTSSLIVRYTSKEGEMVKSQAETSVNHPFRMPGSWRIYQSGYDVGKGRWTSYSTLQCVRDPWAGVSTVALWILMVSAVALAVKSIPRGTRKGFWIIIGILFIIFVWLTFSKVGAGSGNLRPALRSDWFVPHVVSYMFAYAILTGATIFSVVLTLIQKRRRISEREYAALDMVVRLGWSFLTLGLAMGALWADKAWGGFWSWDPKETWAAATWLGYLYVIHSKRPDSRQELVKTTLSLILCFLLLQMCWYGVNWLPSAAGALHSY